MSTWTITGAAFLTSILSAVAGLGGGVALLAVIAQFFAPTVAIPIQGGIQLVANGSRAFALRDDITWPVVGRVILPLLPASLAGTAVAASVPADGTRVVLGLFLLVLVWRPHWLKVRPSGGLSTLGLLGVGAVSGFLNTTVGASGPFTSPFFRAVSATHAAFVATAATAQIAAHAGKLVAYGVAGFNPLDHLGPIGAGATGAVAGTVVGTRFLDRADDAVLDWIFRTVLTMLALRLVMIGLCPLG